MTKPLVLSGDPLSLHGTHIPAKEKESRKASQFPGMLVDNFILEN